MKDSGPGWHCLGAAAGLILRSTGGCNFSAATHTGFSVALVFFSLIYNKSIKPHKGVRRGIVDVLGKLWWASRQDEKITEEIRGVKERADVTEEDGVNRVRWRQMILSQGTPKVNNPKFTLGSWCSVICHPGLKAILSTPQNKTESLLLHKRGIPSFFSFVLDHLFA